MTFYFYDLETSGINAKWQRIMQFGGQRTDENLKPIGGPYQTLVKLTDEILPEPEAVLVTGITPQKTIEEGISEAALATHLREEVFTKDTVALGFNSIRFDDEFIRNLLYRNFHDPYEREWADGRSRWDVLDVARMTRALRPDGINWPITSEGKPTNRLEKLTKANSIEHSNAHDALADVQATIELARLLRSKQSKIFNHLLTLRNKKKVAQLVNPNDPAPFVHSSGRLSSEFFNTSVFLPIATHPTNKNAVISWDLRYSPKKWLDKDESELARLLFSPWQELAKTDEFRLPAKGVHLNKCPAVAPLGVLDNASQERIRLTLDQTMTHQRELSEDPDFVKRIIKAWNRESFKPAEDAEGALYEGFISDSDRGIMQEVHRYNESDLRDAKPAFEDKRLIALWSRYKARNFPATLTDEERATWEQYRANRLKKGPGMTLSGYMNRLAALANERRADKSAIFLLEELQLYGESIVPFENNSLF